MTLMTLMTLFMTLIMSHIMTHSLELTWTHSPAPGSWETGPPGSLSTGISISYGSKKGVFFNVYLFKELHDQPRPGEHQAGSPGPGLRRGAGAPRLVQPGLLLVWRCAADQVRGPREMGEHLINIVASIIVALV